MTFENLLLFRDIVQERSVSRGAALNGVSQPAASQHLRELEERMGVTLLDRSTRPFTLTAAGKIYFQMCRDALQRYEEFQVALEGLKAEVEGTVRIASIYSVGISEMSRLKEEFSRRFPQAALEVEYRGLAAMRRAFEKAHKARFGFIDRAKSLVIDPVLAFSTFLGGTGGGFGDQASAVAVDNSGNVYAAGITSSASFPVTSGSFQTTNHAVANQGTNAFITKLNPTGTALVYSTYLGGSGTSNCTGDAASGLVVDSSGNAYVTGSACSTDFPVTPGAFQTTNKAAGNADGNAFVTKLNPTGTALVYSTYLGGSGLAAESPYGGDKGNAIAVDEAGDAYVTGRTFSTDFPVTPGAYQMSNHAAKSAAWVPPMPGDPK